MNIIGFNESLGIPFKYKNKTKSMHDHIIEGVYQRLKRNTVFYVNGFSMFFNKTHHIKDIVTHNLTLEEIKLLIKYGNDASRNSLITKIGIPNSLRELDPITEQDKNTKIRDILKQDQNIILYASGINDIMYDMNACFYTVIFNNKVRKRVLSMFNDELIEKTLKKVEDNFKMFLSLNSNTNIFVFNFSLDLYIPNIALRISKNRKSAEALKEFVEKYNNALQSLTQKYNLFYIDNRKHYNIKKRTIELIDYISSVELKKAKTVNYELKEDNLGIEGFLQEQKKLMNSYINKNSNDEFIKEKIKEHQLDIDITKKIMEERYGKNDC